MKAAQRLLGRRGNAHHTSHHTLNTTHLKPHTSHLTPHTTRQPSHTTRHTSHATPHTSKHTHHSTPRTSHLTPHTSHLTPHTSHLTPHTSHLTPHTSHHLHQHSITTIVFATSPNNLHECDAIHTTLPRFLPRVCAVPLLAGATSPPATFPHHDRRFFPNAEFECARVLLSQRCHSPPCCGGRQQGSRRR